MAGPLSHPFPATVLSDNRKGKRLFRSASAGGTRNTPALGLSNTGDHTTAAASSVRSPLSPSNTAVQLPSHEDPTTQRQSHSPLTPPDDHSHMSKAAAGKGQAAAAAAAAPRPSYHHQHQPTSTFDSEDTEVLSTTPSHLSLPRQTIHRIRRRLSASPIPGAPNTRSATNSESENEDNDSDFEEVLAMPHVRSSSRASSINLAAVDRDRRSSLMMAPTPGLQADDMPGAKARKVLGLDSEGWELGPGADSSPPSSAGGTSSKGFAGSLRRSVSRLSNDSRGGSHRHSIIPGGLWERATARRQSFSSVGGGAASTPSSPLLLPSTPSSIESHQRSSFMVPSSPLRTASPAQPSPGLVHSPYAHAHALLSPSGVTSTPSPSATSIRKNKGQLPPPSSAERTVSATEQRDWEEELDAAARNASWMSSIAHRPRPKARNASAVEPFGWNASAVESFGGGPAYHASTYQPFSAGSASSRPNSGDLDPFTRSSRMAPPNTSSSPVYARDSPSYGGIDSRASSMSSMSSHAWRQSALQQKIPIALSLPPPDAVRARRQGGGAARRPMADPHPLPSHPPPVRSPMKRSTSMEWINSQHPSPAPSTWSAESSSSQGYVDHTPSWKRRPSLPTPSLRAGMAYDAAVAAAAAAANGGGDTPPTHAPPRPRRSHLRTGSASEQRAAQPVMHRTLSADESSGVFRPQAPSASSTRFGSGGRMEYLTSSMDDERRSPSMLPSTLRGSRSTDLPPTVTRLPALRSYASAGSTSVASSSSTSRDSSAWASMSASTSTLPSSAMSPSSSSMGGPFSSYSRAGSVSSISRTEQLAPPGSDGALGLSPQGRRGSVPAVRLLGVHALSHDEAHQPQLQPHRPPPLLRSHRGNRDSVLDPDFETAQRGIAPTPTSAGSGRMSSSSSTASTHVGSDAIPTRRSRSSTSPLPTSIVFSSSGGGSSGHSDLTSPMSTSSEQARAAATAKAPIPVATVRPGVAHRPMPADVPRPVSMASTDDDHEDGGIDFDESSLDGMIVGSWGSSALGSAGVMGSLAMLQIGGPLDGTTTGDAARRRSMARLSTASVPWPRTPSTGAEDDDVSPKTRLDFVAPLAWPATADADADADAAALQVSTSAQARAEHARRLRDVPDGAAPVDEDEDEDLDDDIVAFLRSQNVVLGA